MPRRRGAARGSPREQHRGAEREVPGRRRRRATRRPLLPVPPAAPLEPARARLDGLRAQARQARGPERAAARQATARRALLAHRRRHRARCPACATSSRSTPTRSCRATRRAQLVATMAHPLNRPRFGSGAAARRRRRGLRHPAAARRREPAERQPHRATRRLFGGEPGIDPYTRAVSDVYQDLFGEGSFIGKGIYDVDAFERALGGRLPENRILSHDLLEGCYARCGPAQRRAAVRGLAVALQRRRGRRHRWIRGDWQIAGWLLPRAARRGAARAARAAQSAVGAVALEDPRQPAAQPGAGRAARAAAARLVRCCREPGVWTLARARDLFVPLPIARRWSTLLRQPDRAGCASQHLSARRRRRRGASCAAGRCMTLACLPYEACVQPRRDRAHAVAHARLAQRRLLEWQPSSERADATPRRAAWRTCVHGVRMCDRARCSRSAPSVGAGAACGPTRSPSPRRCCCCGLSSPVLAWWLDRPLQRRASR